MLITQNYFENYAYLKKMGNSYKLIKCNKVKRKGFEKVNVICNKDEYIRKKGYKYEKYTIEQYIADYSYKETFNVNNINDDEVKLKNNITRARNKILEYVLCNEFVYFVTITLNPNMFDRNNLKEFIKKLGKFINNYNYRNDASIKYLFIPEQHMDGCWHIHGFIMGIYDDQLIKYDIKSNKKLPLYIVNKIKKGDELFYFKEFEEKFGYNIFEKIRNKKASVLYMCKYLTKDISRNVTDLGNHLYYCSKGLKKAEIIKQGQFLDSKYKFDFENDYGSQSMYDDLTDNELEELKSKIGSDPITIDDYRNGYKYDNGWISYFDKDTGEIIGDIPEVLKEVIL